MTSSMVFKLTHSVAVNCEIGCSQLLTMATHANSSQTKFKLRWWLPGKWHASLAKFFHFFFTGPQTFLSSGCVLITFLSSTVQNVMGQNFTKY